METMCSTTTCDALTGSYVIYPQLKHTVCEIHSYFWQKACDMPMICDRPMIKAAAYRIPVFHPTWCTGKVYQNILTLEYKGNQNSFLYMNPPWLPAPPVSQHNIASVTRSPSVGIEFTCWWHCGALGRLLLFQCPPAGVSQQSAGSSIQLHLATPTGRELKYHLLWLLAHMAPCSYGSLPQCFGCSCLVHVCCVAARLCCHLPLILPCIQCPVALFLSQSCLPSSHLLPQFSPCPVYSLCRYLYS